MVRFEFLFLLFAFSFKSNICFYFLSFQVPPHNKNSYSLIPCNIPIILISSRYHRAFFYCILAVISFFLSETISGRRTVSLGFENLYLMYPVYFFHFVVLSWLVLKVTDGKPTFPILFISGLSHSNPQETEGREKKKTWKRKKGAETKSKYPLPPFFPCLLPPNPF